jgi:hypothetical protein
MRGSGRQKEWGTMENESALNPQLEAKLRRMRLRAEFTDADTLKLRSVPASDVFSKERTNLLIKRSVGAMPSVVCVDDDLEYTGKDRLLSQAFADTHAGIVARQRPC